MVKRRLETVEDARHRVGHCKQALTQNNVSLFHSIYCGTKLEVIISELPRVLSLESSAPLKDYFEVRCPITRNGILGCIYAQLTTQLLAR